MPGGSSVRSLNPRSLKPTRNRNSQPSLSVGHTELTALLYMLSGVFQKSKKKNKKSIRAMQLVHEGGSAPAALLV